MSRIYVFLFLLVSLFSCSPRTSVEPVEGADDSRDNGKLVVVTDDNSINYYIYKGRPMGYQYEMLREYANYSGLKIELIVNADIEENFKMLADGRADLIAMNLAVTSGRKFQADFTLPHSKAKQVLVQRASADGQPAIRDVLDLAGKTIIVKRGTAYIERLHNLSVEIGDSIFYQEVDQSVEKLVELVAKGEIDYTICDEHFAKISQSYYRSIDIATPISFTQNLAWAVGKGNETLLNSVNGWFGRFSKSRKFAEIYERYYNNPQSYRSLKDSYYAIQRGYFTQYDRYLQKYSKLLGWDWRLLASLIYQESKFQHDAKSHAGAYGIMQLMPSTADIMGVDSTASAEEHIRAGVKYLAWLDKKLSDIITDDHERIKFVLAAYNVGLGHVLDARNLAKKHGRSPDIWEGNVDFYLLNKTLPQYYNDPVVKYGYCRGTEPYRYVTEVLERYEHYQNIIR